MNNRIILIALLVLPLLFSCQQDKPRADAYGNFESTGTIVSAQARGQLLHFSVEEGNRIPQGKLVGLVDTTDLHLQRKLLQARINSLGHKTTNPQPEIDVLKRQKSILVKEKVRIENLLAANAATGKQLDDITGQIEIVDQQILAAKEKSDMANRSILSEKDPLIAQLAVIEKQIKDCYIYNPLSGIVLDKLREPSEIVNFSAPLYVIANLDTMILRAYADAITLQKMTLGKHVTVLIDQDPQEDKQLEGHIVWISEEAEFTPKTIQTKKERVNLVYAIKIAVANDGSLKQGMPGEVWLSMDHSQNQE